MELTPLIHRFRGPLAGLFAAWGTPWHDAHELAQDTFVEAYLARDTFRGDLANPKAVGAWLRGIARNLFRMWSRRRRRQAAEPIEQHDPALPKAEPIASEVVALRAAIDQLPSKLQRVIYMHYLDEAGIAEVAGLLGVSVRAVEGRLYRARAALKNRLADCAVARRALEASS